MKFNDLSGQKLHNELNCEPL